MQAHLISIFIMGNDDLMHIDDRSWGSWHFFPPLRPFLGLHRISLLAVHIAKTIVRAQVFRIYFDAFQVPTDGLLVLSTIETDIAQWVVGEFMFLVKLYAFLEAFDCLIISLQKSIDPSQAIMRRDWIRANFHAFLIPSNGLLLLSFLFRVQTAKTKISVHILLIPLEAFLVALGCLIGFSTLLMDHSQIEVRGLIGRIDVYALPKARYGLFVFLLLLEDEAEGIVDSGIWLWQSLG